MDKHEKKRISHEVRDRVRREREQGAKGFSIRLIDCGEELVSEEGDAYSGIRQVVFACEPGCGAVLVIEYTLDIPCLEKSHAEPQRRRGRKMSPGLSLRLRASA